MDNSCYKILDILPQASAEEINKAHKELAKLYHPDKHSSLPGHIRELAEQKMAEINQARDEALRLLNSNNNVTNTRTDLVVKKVPFSINSLAFSPDSRFLVIGGKQPSIYIWQLGNFDGFKSLRVHGKCVYDLKFVNNAKTLLTVGNSRTVRMWDLVQGRKISRFKGHEDQINCLEVNNLYALSGSDDKSLYLWDCRTGQKVKKFGSFNPFFFSPMEGHQTGVTACALSRNLKLALSADNQGDVIIWNINNGSQIGLRRAHSQQVFSLVFLPDSNTFLTAGDNKNIRIWSCTTEKKLGRLKGHNDNVNTIAISNNGRFLLSGSDDATLRLWDLYMTKEVACLEGHHCSIKAIALSPNNRYVATGSSDGTVCLWKLTNKEYLAKL